MYEHYMLINKRLLFLPEDVPFHMCHASNLCLLGDGSMAAAWFAGSAEGADDTAIWVSLCRDGNWSFPRRVAGGNGLPHWNPVLYERQDKTLVLFYKTGRVIAKWKTMYRISCDGGETFSEEQELVPGDTGGRGPVRCKVITLSDGSILAGTSTEEGIWTSYADRSEDEGQTWALSNPIRIVLQESSYEKAAVGNDTADAVKSGIPLTPQSFAGRGVIQPTLWESSAGIVHMLLRSSEGRIFRSVSADYGRTWQAPRVTELPNNNSGIDVVRTETGLLVLCMNPVAENFGPRTPLILMVSEDDGDTWSTEAVLEDAPADRPDFGPEYSYPSVIAGKERLFVTYTHNRESIAFCVLERRK